MGLMSPRMVPHSLEVARRTLLDFVGGRRREEAITVVFDGQSAPITGSARQAHRKISVYFARVADDLIEELIAREHQPLRLMVVSDDRRIQAAARRRGCRVVECLVFLEQIHNPPSTPAKSSTEAEDKPDSLSDSEIEGWLREFGEGN